MLSKRLAALKKLLSFSKKTGLPKQLKALKRVFTTLGSKVRHLLGEKQRLEKDVATAEARITEMTEAEKNAAAEIEKLIAEGEALIAELDAKP